MQCMIISEGHSDEPVYASLVVKAFSDREPSFSNRTIYTDTR
jgi:hypothetical protein